MSILQSTFDKHKKLMLESIIEKEIPSGQYYHIDDVRLAPRFKGKGLGKKMYEVLMSCIPTDSTGLLSTYSSKLNTSKYVTPIYKSMGGSVGIKGNRDTYDVALLKNFKKIKLYYSEPKRNHLIHRESANGDEFIFKLRGYPNPIEIDVYSKNENAEIGHIYATRYPWDAKKEIGIGFEDIESAEADAEESAKRARASSEQEKSSIKGKLTLTHDGKNVVEANISANIGRAIVQKHGDDAKYFSSEQFQIQKQKDDTWKLIHNKAATNITTIDGKEVTEPTTLVKGMKIALGKTGKFPMEVG